MEPIEFLSVRDVLDIHHDQIKRYGGTNGIRDRKGLVSAMEKPRTTFENIALHPDLWNLAAAYIFHISQNHPFLDGNKRTALTSGLVFLYINGIEMKDPDGRLYELIIDVASGNDLYPRNWNEKAVGFRRNDK